MSARPFTTTEILNTNPISPYIVFGEIAHPINPGPLNRASILQKRNQKAVSYAQPAQPITSKVAHKHAGSENLPPPKKVQHNKIPLNTNPPHINTDTWTAVNNWLATSPTFEAPPKPASIVDSDPDPASEYRLHKEHWLCMSKDLDLRMKARSETQRLRMAEAIKVKAKQLAADAMAKYKREQERRKYVEWRARDVHEDMLRCRPFDVDALRREFSETEVLDVKRIVRDLGFAEKK